MRRFSTYLFGLLAMMALLIVPALPHHHHDGKMAVAMSNDCCHTHRSAECPATEHHSTPCHHNQGIKGEMPTRIVAKPTQKAETMKADRRVANALFLTSDAVFASEIRLPQTSRGAPPYLLPPDWGRGAQGLRAPPVV